MLKRLIYILSCFQLPQTAYECLFVEPILILKYISFLKLQYFNIEMGQLNSLSASTFFLKNDTHLAFFTVALVLHDSAAYFHAESPLSTV